ncbi:TIR domain-containing protein [Acaryochloris sp. IP29b_bin.137]|uniref:nSTAND1 domain-containing NTPase n=1 Tax=Acaryochloris sp. IP29b_bin.137 TaxID=2969217 RepID=UPI00262D2030|nr:TIR domain-containing protein [Acaryochloris sp. IP29b_bin.137]
MVVKKYDLFISYADADRAWVEGYLLSALEQADIQCHTKDDFNLGLPKLLAIERAIQESKWVVLIISNAYMAEVANNFIERLSSSYGLETGTWPVIPLILEPVQLPTRLNTVVHLNATDPSDRKDVIARLCNQLKPGISDLPSRPPCPYPGMVPFSEVDSDCFFGRDNEIEDAKRRLHQFPLITMIGPSGSGKSSLVFAGLIPALRQSDLFGTGNWLVLDIRPGKSPLSTLKATLGSDLVDPNLAITEVLMVEPEAKRMLLVVDQFEEVFAQAEQEKANFQQALLRLIEIPNLYIILTVRADFYPDLMESPLWPKIQFSRMEIIPLNPSNLHEAIIQPAKDAGVFVEAILAERLVADAVGEPGVLPLIQETLVLLWEKVEEQILHLSAYESLVLDKAYKNFDGSNRTGLQIAIANRADATIAALDQKQLPIIRRIFLRLIQFGEGRADTRRQQSVEQLLTLDDDIQLFNETLLFLADRRLLTLSGTSEDVGRKVDIAHEALIDGWPTLQLWLSERREAELTRRQLMRRVEDWIWLEKSSNHGLLDEAQLAEAKRWLNSQDAQELGQDEVLLELVEVSDSAIQDNLAYERILRQKAQRRAKIAIFSAVIASTAAISFLVQLSQTIQGEINSLTALSNSYLAENKQIEALVTSMKAGKKLQSPMPWMLHKLHLLSDTTHTRTVAVLAKSVYEIQELNRLEGHSAPIRGISVSPDEQSIASAGDDRTIRIWGNNGKLKAKWIAHKDRVTSVNFSPNLGQKKIVSSSIDGTVKLWDTSGRIIWEKSHTQPVHNVVFSRDGKNIASTSDDKMIRIWNEDGRLIHTLMDHKNTVFSASFDLEGNTIASASLDNTVKLWNLSNGQTIKTLNHNHSVNSVAFSPDGQIVASGTQEGKIRFWSKDGQELQFCDVDHNASINEIKFLSDNQIASAGEDKAVKLWSLGRQNNVLSCTLLQTFKGHTGTVHSLSSSTNTGRSLIISGGDDNVLRFWNLKENPFLKILDGHTMPVLQVRFSPDSQYLASVSLDKLVKVWKLNNGEYFILKDLVGHYRLDFAPKAHNPLLALASSDNTVKLWSFEKERIIKTLGGHNNTITSLRFSPNGKNLASASWDGTVKIWNIEKLDKPTVIESPNEVFTHLIFSPDGQKLALATEENKLQLWQLDQERPITLGKLEQTINDINFSPDGEIVAVASEDKTIQIWNLEGEKLFAIDGQEESITSVAFSPYGRIIASTTNNTVKLWNRAGGSLASFKSNKDTFQDISFNSDGKSLIAASMDNRVVIWNLELDTLLDKGCVWLDDYQKNNLKISQTGKDIC